MTASGSSGQGDDSTVQLVSTAAEQLGQLVRQEIALAQTELSQKAKRAGAGVGVLGAAGIVALYGLGATVAAAIIALGLVVPLWLSAVIIAVVLFVIAAVAALVGKKQVSKATPPAEHTINSVKADIDTVKGGQHS